MYNKCVDVFQVSSISRKPFAYNIQETLQTRLPICLADIMIMEQSINRIMTGNASFCYFERYISIFDEFRPYHRTTIVQSLSRIWMIEHTANSSVHYSQGVFPKIDGKYRVVFRLTPSGDSYMRKS